MSSFAPKTFIPRPNTGSLWSNDRKTEDKHPDWKGDLFVDPGLLSELSKSPEHGLVKIAISGWQRDLNGRVLVSLNASAPYVSPQGAYQRQQQAPVVRKPPVQTSAEDEDVPF
jgi:hypothetical protein